MRNVILFVLLCVVVRFLELTEGYIPHTPFKGKGFIFEHTNGQLSSYGLENGGPPTDLRKSNINYIVSTSLEHISVIERTDGIP